MTANGSVLWLLNLDAEEELAAAGAYVRSKAMQGIVRDKAGPLMGRLVLAQDRVLDGEVVVSGGPVLAWCPSPFAQATCERHGLALLGALPIGVLRKVNHKAFAAEHADEILTLAGAQPIPKWVCQDMQQVQARLAQRIDQPTLVRRAYGAAGRAQLRLKDHTIDAGAQSWLRAGLRSGSLVLEPLVQVLWEASTCGWVEPDGTIHTRAPTRQNYDKQGAWIGNWIGPDAQQVPMEFQETLLAAAHSSAQALSRAGYSGPFGIDSFAYLRPDQKIGLHPVSDINARFTMDWADSFPDWLRSGRLIDLCS